jgi:hypothetical protein
VPANLGRVEPEWHIPQNKTCDAQRLSPTDKNSNRKKHVSRRRKEAGKKKEKEKERKRGIKQKPAIAQNQISQRSALILKTSKTNLNFNIL